MLIADLKRIKALIRVFWEHDLRLLRCCADLDRCNVSVSASRASTVDGAGTSLTAHDIRQQLLIRLIHGTFKLDSISNNSDYQHCAVKKNKKNSWTMKSDSLNWRFTFFGLIKSRRKVGAATGRRMCASSGIPVARFTKSYPFLL